MFVDRFIAWRFLLKGTAAGKFSPMTLFAWLAIGVGVGAMSSLLSVMYGFESALKERVLMAYPHVMVKPVEGNLPLKDYQGWTNEIQKTADVARVMPYAEAEMIAQSEFRTVGAVVWGVPDDEFARMKPKITEGKAPSRESKLPQVVIGSELAVRLSAVPGEKIKLISPIEKRGAMGMVPQADTFEVSGIYMSGHYEFDQQYVFLLLEDAQDLMKIGDAISGWHIWAKELSQSERVRDKIAAVLPKQLKAESWETFNSALFQSLKLEQYAMFSILTFAIAIAVMNIVITLMMHVTHKRMHIGVLRALGASKDQVKRIFLFQGAFMGGVGLAIGALITVLFVIYIRYFSSYQLPDIYYDRSLPIEIRPLSLLLIYVVATAMIYLGILYPATRAAGVHPIEAIRE